MVLQSFVHPLQTLEQLNKQRESQLFTDVTVLVGGEKFNAHRAILAAHSPVFKSVLKHSSLSQETLPSINLDGVESSYFSILLDFIYTSKLEISAENVAQILALSSFLEVSSVEDLCNNFVKRKVEKDQSKSAKISSQIEIKGQIDSTGNTEELVGNQEKPFDLNLEAEDKTQVEIEVLSEEEEIEQYQSLDDKSYKSENDLFDNKLKKRGRKALNRIECPICNKSFTESKFRPHYFAHTGENPSTRCASCGKCFANVYNLKIHERTHTGERPYACLKCSKTFSDPSSLSKHKLWHAGTKKQSCKICERRFSTVSQVRDHMRTHTKERPFSCSICSKTFGYKCDLIRHTRDHTGDLFGPCQHCGRQFNHRGNYKAHLRSHEKNLNSIEPIETNLQSPNVYFVPDNIDNSAENVTSQTDESSTILKMDDLAHLVSQGHEIEVMINDGKLMVKQSSPLQLNIKDTGDGITMPHNEQLLTINDHSTLMHLPGDVITIPSDVMNVHDDVINVRKDEDSLVIVDQIMDVKYSS